MVPWVLLKPKWDEVKYEKLIKQNLSARWAQAVKEQPSWNLIRDKYTEKSYNQIDQKAAAEQQLLHAHKCKLINIDIY